jgi:hypothetical protein
MSEIHAESKTLGCRHSAPEDWIRTELALRKFQNPCRKSRSHQSSKPKRVGNGDIKPILVRPGPVDVRVRHGLQSVTC